MILIDNNYHISCRGWLNKSQEDFLWDDEDDEGGYSTDHSEPPEDHSKAVADQQENQPAAPATEIPPAAPVASPSDSVIYKF